MGNIFSGVEHSTVISMVTTVQIMYAQQDG